MTSVCTSLLSPICQVTGGVGSTLLGSGASDVLSALAGWVAGGADWLLGQIGSAIETSTNVDLSAGWFSTHYQVMAGLMGIVLLPLLLLSAVQAIYRQSAGMLVRVLVVQLPLATLLGGVALQVVQMSIAVTDGLGNLVAGGVGADITQALAGVATTLVSEASGGPQSAPGFVVLLGALLVAVGAFVLWIELLVRSAAVYVAVLFLPLALASLVWPAISHWCRRLVDTLVALILSKFVIVAVLSLAASALASGAKAGFASILGGGALLLLAAFTPFTLLRLVPAVEAGAVQQLEGARHRVRQAVPNIPRSAASFALRRARETPLATGPIGTGMVGHPEPPGPSVDPPPRAGEGSARAGGGGIPFWSASPVTPGEGPLPSGGRGPLPVRTASPPPSGSRGRLLVDGEAGPRDGGSGVRLTPRRATMTRDWMGPQIWGWGPVEEEVTSSDPGPAGLGPTGGAGRDRGTR